MKPVSPNGSLRNRFETETKLDEKQNLNEGLNERFIARENENISWLRRHFAWILPSNVGRSRFSYSKKLKLQIHSTSKQQLNDYNDVIFKPWSNVKIQHAPFQTIYNDLRNGITWNENKSFCNYLQIILQFIIFISLSPILAILILILYGSIIITQVILPFIVSIFRSKFEDSDIGIKEPESGIRLTTKSGTIHRMRFDVYRLTQYLYWITIHLFRVLSRLIAGRQRIPLVKDEELIVYMHSNQHLKLEKDDNNNIIGGYIDNSDIIDIAEHNLFEGRYFPIKKIHLDYKTNVLSFTLNGRGKEDRIISNKPGDCSDKVWNAIKASYFGQRCLMDTLTHSWVHFHFSDIASKYIYKYFGSNPSTVLGRLIHSHFLYTSVLNLAGAGDSFNQPQIKGDYNSLINILNPLKINPINIEGFVSVILMRIKKHYFDENNLSQLDLEMFPPRDIKYRLKMFNSNNYKNIRGYNLYMDMLSDYYLSVYQFISKLNENGLIDLNELRGFIDLIDNDGMKGLSKCDELHVLSTLIWTNAFIHGTDHITYGNFFRNFPFFGCYNKLDSISNDNQDIDIDYKSILYSWKSMWRSFKSEIFINSFTVPQISCLNCIADYSASPALYRYFRNIPSLKSNGKLELINKIHDKYLRSLHKVSDKYDWMIDINEIDASISY